MVAAEMDQVADEDLRTLTLSSSDNVSFVLTRNAAFFCRTISSMVDGLAADISAFNSFPMVIHKPR